MSSRPVLNQFDFTRGTPGWPLVIVNPLGTFDMVYRRSFGSGFGSGFTRSPVLRLRAFHFFFGLEDAGVFGTKKISRRRS